MSRAFPSRRVVATILSGAILAAGSLVFAQQIWVGGYRGYGSGARFAKIEDFDGSFLYCRGFYRSRWQEAGGSGWRTDYPGADNNFSVRLAELTAIPVKFDPDKQPHYVVIPLTDPTLFHCPMLFMEDVGTIDFSAEEVKRLREFFHKGGFLWTDDSWGSIAWQNWQEQIGRVLPPGEYPFVDVPLNHPIMHLLYNVPNIPQVPNIGFWRNTGQTSERGSDSAQVYFKGIFDSHQRLMVLTTHNTDISDTWEREGAPPHEYFDLFSPRGYAIGVNVILYAMTH